MRADLVGLGVQLEWPGAEAPEEQAVAAILERLQVDGECILLIYDNAVDPKSLRQFLPRGGGPDIVITSNAPNWGGLAASVEIEVWPKDVGADFLVARTGRATERDAALALSEALGGLALAHEQAAAYCERTGMPLAEYRRRFEATPNLLDNVHDAAREYHDGLTVAKTFALAIDEAAKLHPAAEPLIVYAALLASEPVPLYLFSEGQLGFSEPFASQIKSDGLDEAIAALRTLALIDRELIPDERDPSILTDCIRLHRLVRQVAGDRRTKDVRAGILKELVASLATAYPRDVFDDTSTWPRCRRLNTLALGVIDDELLLDWEDSSASELLDKLGKYKQRVSADFGGARVLFERALRIDEKIFGPKHANTAAKLNNLAHLLSSQGDPANGKLLYERALAIHEDTLGAEHENTIMCLNNFAVALEGLDDLAGARSCAERALVASEKTLGQKHPETGRALNILGCVLES